MTEPRIYLRSIHLERFGRFHDTVVGPFSDRMNIVLGANEAGKTTVASFVGGVLFGWEEARGNRNTYKPEGAERAGSLLFARSAGADANASAREDEETFVLSRARNADGLQGDTFLVEDIDKDTYRTMFSLNSDELRSLRNTTDTTAKLLTAGSGTGSSPGPRPRSCERALGGIHLPRRLGRAVDPPASGSAQRPARRAAERGWRRRCLSRPRSRAARAGARARRHGRAGGRGQPRD